MRKRVKGRILSREKSQRKALLRSLGNDLFLNERIKTTEAKAKELRSFAEKLITKAKRGDLSSRRYLRRYLNEDVVKKLVDELAPRYQKRAGGYTRILKTGPRESDGAKMVIVELVE